MRGVAGEDDTVKTLDVRKIGRIVEGKVSRSDVTTEVTGFSVDSRTIKAGDLFIPLRGERFDGHDFLLEAVRRGAVACLSEEPCAGLSVPVIMVQDTLVALGDMAAAARGGFSGPVVGVTGSAGKSTTKEMVSGILSLTGPGLKTEGNLNNLVGLPLTLERVAPEHQWMVLEMGTSQLGEIARLTEIARPTVGVITNIGPSHLSGLRGLDGVARAKAELFAGLGAGSWAVINADDPRVLKIPVANGVERLLFGISPEAQVRAEEIGVTADGVRFLLRLPDGGAYQVQLPVYGRHNVGNALAAAAVAFCLKVPPAVIVKGLEHFSPMPARLELCSLPKDVVLLDDTYNANPASVAAALETLADMTVSGRKIAVLGDMLELGEYSADMHFEVGQKVAKRADYLILLGTETAALRAGALHDGMAEENIWCCADHEEAAACLLKLVQPGDRILLKGSRKMRMERIRGLFAGQWQIN